MRDGNCTEKLALFDHLRNLDLARGLLLDLERMKDACPGCEPACKAMASFAADILETEDREASQILRDWARPERQGPLGERIAARAREVQNALAND